MIEISKAKGRIFRITHIGNVPWILANGLHSRNTGKLDPDYREIGNPDLIQKRHHRAVEVPPKGTLSDYIPFYFTPYSPMLLNIKTGYNGMKQTPMPDIAILVARTEDLVQQDIPFIVSDRHAYLATATFVAGKPGLDLVDWDLLQSRDFRRDPNDPGKFERYQAEALVFNHLPVAAISSVLCYGPGQEAFLRQHAEALGCHTPIFPRPGCYF